MKYFVPAWYDNEKWWHQLPQPFYMKNRKMQFDDAISLMSMHVQNESAFKLLNLSYQPHLRLFLHKYDLYEVATWSLFDEIQGFKAMPSRSFQFEDLEWPDDATFIFSPYMIQVIANHITSKVYFSQEGYLIWLDDFEDDQHKRRYIFDERGYLSAIRYYTKGVAQIQDYLTVNGEVILRENLLTDQVEVMAPFEAVFEAQVYHSMTELIKERFDRFCVRHMTNEDHLIVSAHIQHNMLFQNMRVGTLVSYSIFSKRNVMLDDMLIHSMSNGSKWLVDTMENETQLKILSAHSSHPLEILRMTPFDTQQLNNLSSQLNETYIGVWIDGMSHTDLQSVLYQLTDYIQNHPSYRLVLLTQQDVGNVADWIEQLSYELNERHNETTVEDAGKEELIKAKEPTSFEELIQIRSVPYEEDVLKALTHLRLVIDLSEEPDLYVQIASISVRIPQIHMLQSYYVTHRENGMIIDNYEQLHMALDYFLSTLKHWNTAYTFNTNLIETLSSHHIIQQLDQFLEGDSDGTTV
ncbi:TPA: accessory Sec system protein Asp1 [Staphylococcus delphini]|nr:accessory Sec system protein Asp1 [Staphylococcus delphini]HEC2243619.1 accessory Sec system protein Asp1 [Staphylococcus delphini]